MFSAFISLHKAYMKPTGHTDISPFLAEEFPLTYNYWTPAYRFNSLENSTATQPSVKHDP